MDTQHDQQQPVTSANLENVTLNTTSVESKVGLYTKVSVLSLWVLVIFAASFLTSLFNGATDSDSFLITISIAIIVAPIFVIADQKRRRELKANPALHDDIFVKKYIRKHLFTSIVLTAISAVIFVFSLLKSITDTGSSSDDLGHTIVGALMFSLGFGAVLAFCWAQHARTTR